MQRALLGTLIVFLFLTGCSQKTIPEVDFKDTVAPEEAPHSQASELTICVGSMLTPQEGYVYYKKLLDYIGKKLDVKVNFIEKSTYMEVNSLLKDGVIDVAFVCGGPYVKGHDEFGLELIVAPVVDGKTVYYSYVIVAEKSGIEKLEDLKGKAFAFVDPLSNTGRLIPTLMLSQIGETPQHFFKECLYTYSHDASIRAVAQGIIDGAAVDSLVWEYLNKKNNKHVRLTKIIKVSEPYGIPPVVCRPGLNSDLKAKLKDILLHMHDEDEGKHILREMFVDRFVEVDNSLYDSIRESYAKMGL